MDVAGAGRSSCSAIRVFVGDHCRRNHSEASCRCGVIIKRYSRCLCGALQTDRTVNCRYFRKVGVASKLYRDRHESTLVFNRMSAPLSALDDEKFKKQIRRCIIIYRTTYEEPGQAKKILRLQLFRCNPRRRRLADPIQNPTPDSPLRPNTLRSKLFEATKTTTKSGLLLHHDAVTEPLM